MRKRLVLSMGKVHELICEEHEHNPLVGTAMYETREFLMKLGYSLGGASAVLNRIERIYDLNLYRRPKDGGHTDSGDVVNREFGVTRTHNTLVYWKIIGFYRRRLKKGMSKEEAIKETHEHYDPILAKERGYEPQTEEIAMVVPNTLSASGRCKDLSDLDIEI